MTLHQHVPASTPVSEQSAVFRLRALFSEQRAAESSNPASKQDWEELAVEWHTMANLAARPKSGMAPARFGIKDTPACPKCKSLMGLTRRMPHPKYDAGSGFERQTFTCTGCRHEIERNADCLGEVVT
jgi:hypothetical protein